ncbi:MAG: hypothetical protein IIX97_03990 [Clostridia bacterium]|nr:hypothetical protein [Clostridia bacterium]MBQ1259248.1 hypothetical protein [Clostridia bacterium]
MFFKKWRQRKKQTKLENAIDSNSVSVSEIAGQVDAIAVGLGKITISDESIKARLNEVQRNIRYFNPTTDKRALKIDGEISSILKDIRSDIEVAIVKKDDVTEKINAKLVKVEMLIPDRKTYSE